MPVERRVVATAWHDLMAPPVWVDDVDLRLDSRGRWRTGYGQSEEQVVESLVDAGQKHGPHVKILVDGVLERWVCNGDVMRVEPVAPVEFREGPDGKHRPRLEEWAMA